jgi:hypothetical protein
MDIWKYCHSRASILIQVLVQVYFIHQCWQNGQLSLRTRLLYMAAIALFNIPAAAVYLLFTRKHQAVPAQQADKQLRQGIFILLLVAFEIISLRFNRRKPRASGSSGLVMAFGAVFWSRALLDGLLKPPEMAGLAGAPHPGGQHRLRFSAGTRARTPSICC